MEQKIGMVKIFWSALVLAIVTAYPLVWLHDQYYPSGSFLADLSNNIYISTFIGLAITLPLFLAILGVIFFDLHRYKELIKLIVIPTFLVDLFWMIGDVSDFIIIFAISLIFAVLGLAIGLLIKFIYKKLHLNR